jgi:hypothetical protein
MRITDLDLFPIRVKVLDFDDDPALNAGVLAFVEAHPDFNDSTTGRNLLAETGELACRLREKFNLGLRLYLRDLGLDVSRPLEVDAYMFTNYTRGSSFTPYHDHVGDADFVAIYYASAHQYEREDPAGSYYAMDEGLLVLHAPSRPDAAFDRRSLATRDHYKIYPRPNRMVIQPGSLPHSVTASQGGTRLAVTCNFIIGKSSRLEGYVGYRLDLGNG